MPPHVRMSDAQPVLSRSRVRGWVVATLLALVMPLLLAVTSIAQDYVTIRALAVAGMQHLLAAKSDLSGFGQMAATLTMASAGSVNASSSAPYTLLVQRQAGSAYQTRVTIQPSTSLEKAGFTSEAYQGALGINTALMVAPSSSALTPTPPNPAPAVSAGKGASPVSNSLAPTPQTLRVAQVECRAAQRAFLSLRNHLDRQRSAISLISGIAPVGTAVETARALDDIGYNAATLGVLYVGAALPVLTKLESSTPSDSQPPLGQRDIAAVEQTIARSQPILVALQAQLDRLDLSHLPLSEAQKGELASVKAELPILRQDVGQAGVWLSALVWLLGIDQPRNFLLESLDPTELRASGGFAGDFAIVHVRDGKVAPLSLVPVARTDYKGKAWDDGWDARRRPPAPYSWWPIADWGLRDANLSADFPTTAQLTMTAYQGECGLACQAAGMPASIDGVIQATPAAIEQILHVTGPMPMPEYHVTVTAANLEYEVHYFSLQRSDGSYPPGPNGRQPTDRKDFLYAFAHRLEARMHALPQRAFATIAMQMLQDVKSKDIQIYVTNPSVESLLRARNMAGVATTPVGQDTDFVVQTNVTGAKANPCVTLTQTDDVRLDDAGGATHHLTIAMYHQGGAGTAGNCDPWYGEFSTYHAYMRVYAPAGAQLQHADGFDQNRALCVASCSADPYPGGELVCPPSGYMPGGHMPSIIRPIGDEAGVLDRLGPPTQTTSDLPGMATWGGFVTIPPNCTAKLTLDWYMPGVVHQA